MRVAVDTTSDLERQAPLAPMPGKRALTDILITVVEELVEAFEDDDEISLDTILFGEEGVLDSLELVRLVVAAEQAIEDEYGVLVSLADEKAMSEHNAPFRSIETFVNYARQRIAEA